MKLLSLRPRIQSRFWQPPRLHGGPDETGDRRATWLELFLDLYFVVAVAQIAHGLNLSLNLEGLIEFIALFLPLAWVWVGITYYRERFESDGFEDRIITLVFMVCVGAMAMHAHHGLTEQYAGYMLAYCCARLFTMLLWIWAGIHNGRFRAVARRYAIGFGVAIAVALTSIFFDGPLRYVMLGAALALEILTPWLSRKAMVELPPVSVSKHPERFGLFMIVMLGEAVTGVVAGTSGAEHRPIDLLFAAFLGIILGFSVWWVYFDFIARRPVKPTPTALYLWVYLHLLMYGSIAVLGVAIHHAIDSHGGDPEHGHILPFDIRIALVGALGVFLLSVGLTETLLRRSSDEMTHALWSPASKIASGVILPFIALLPLGRFALFVCFYPLLFGHVVYAAVLWARGRPVSEPT